ncbi:MAG: B3/4 domain-containing protein [Candidatus Thorarchaeota archaeon]
MKIAGIEFEVDRDDISLSLIRLDELRVEPSREGWEDFERGLFETIRSSTSLEDVKDDELFRSYRDLYWTFGMDPTKLRVSSEALLRRVVNGLNLWRISNIVDVVNVASPMHKIPIGLVDITKVVGNLRVRIARKGEVFVRIGGTEKICRGRELVLADDEKIVCFGYATHDSELTKVSTDSTQVYLLHYGAPAVSLEYLKTSSHYTLELVKDWVDCQPSEVSYFRPNSQ